MKRISAYLLISVAELFGGGSLVLFAIFVFAGPVVSVPLNFSERGVLYWDALLSLLFFAQHSLMVRRWFKDRLAPRIPRDFHGAIYAIGSGAVLGPAMLLWQPSTVDVFTASGAPGWAMRAIGVLGIAGFVWGVRSLPAFDAFGRLPIVARLHHASLPPSELVVRGAYRWVRHPLMFFMLVMLLAHPHVTADRALFNVLWGGWLVVGSFLEERDLVAEFGAPYRAYQHAVPMLLPWRGPAGKSLRQTRPPAAPHAA